MAVRSLARTRWIAPPLLALGLLTGTLTACSWGGPTGAGVGSNPPAPLKHCSTDARVRSVQRHIPGFDCYTR